MKQTVLEWFIQEFEKEPTKANLDRLNEQAKEMEKQQQCYSEEEVLKILINCPTNTEKETIEWFEQFKKK
jgi:hypothetical protein